MMTINGKEVAFDLDVRTNYAKYVKAHQDLERKHVKGSIDATDMEVFLKTCLEKEEVEEILQDGRISTLAKSFAEFFNQAVDQLEKVLDIYQDSSELLTDAYQKVNTFDFGSLPAELPTAKPNPERPISEV